MSDEQTTQSAIDFLKYCARESTFSAYSARDKQLGDHALESNLCGLMEHFEIYIRRICEKLTDGTSTRVGSKFRDNYELLCRLVGQDVLTEKQVNEIRHLKDVRNLAVHNNFVVDHDFTRRVPGTVEGERLEVAVYLVRALMTTMVGVRQIDQLVLQKRPDLQAKWDMKESAEIGALFTKAMIFLKLSIEEQEMVFEGMRLLSTSDHPFNPATLNITLPQMRHNNLWTIAKQGDDWWASSFKEHMVGPFQSPEDAQAWLDAPLPDFSEMTIENDLGDWVVLSTGEGLNFRWRREEI